MKMTNHSMTLQVVRLIRGNDRAEHVTASVPASLSCLELRVAFGLVLGILKSSSMDETKYWKQYGTP